MKNYIYTLLFFTLLYQPKISFSQCTILNKDFTDVWIVGTLVNFADVFDPADWYSTQTTSLNAATYFESGLYPAPGSTSGTDAVEFNLSGSPRETGIQTLVPIVCSNYPQSIKASIKHTGVGSDTLYFYSHYSTIDDWGDTTREIITAALICSTPISSDFQDFEIPVQLPHLDVYTQIDTFRIIYKSVSANPGIFVLDKVDFSYTTSSHDYQEWLPNIKISPTITRQYAHISIPAPIPDLQVSLIDIIGVTVWSNNCDTQGEIDIDLSRLEDGIYYVSVKHPDGHARVVKKLVKI
jgi:hypothetical protein